MKRIESPAGAFAIHLSYQVNISIVDGQPDRGAQFELPEGDRNRILGAAWAALWEQFVDSVCHPHSQDGGRLFRQVEPVRHPDFPPVDRDGRDIGKAYTFTPGTLDKLPDVNPADPADVGRLLEFFSHGARPDLDFVGNISDSPIRVRGERLADGVGYAFNRHGEKELGIVFRAQLLDYYAEQGSLRTAGIAVLTFFGTTLLPQLFAIALSAPSLNTMGEFNNRRVIEQRLEVQGVLCDVTAGFHFDRKLLVMQLEHKLSVGGRSGVCEVQAALEALNFAPGRIDGVSGPDTHAAAIAFAAAWGLTAHDIGRPVFFNLLARGLMGERPPYK